MRIKKLLSFAVAAAMTISALCGAMSITAFAAEEVSNSCGDGVVWEYDTATTTLKFSYTGEGTGVMTDYENSTKTPWRNYDTRATSIVFEEGITHIGACSFVNFSKLTSLSLPDTLKSIGREGFYSFKMTSIELPSSLETIGEEAFYASKLTEITIPGSVKTISASAFLKSTSLVTVNLNEGLQTIGANAFQNCTKINGVTIPGTVQSIGDLAFQSCSGMLNLTFSEGSTETVIGANAFEKCSKLANITLANHITTIGENAFLSCNALKDVAIPKSVKEIKNNAFDSSGIETITIEKADTEEGGLTTLGNSVFSNCSSLLAIDLPDTITTMGTGVFSNCSKMTTANIPSSLTAIPNSSFNSCRALESATISSKITSIGDNAFSSCVALTDLSIPSSVKTIGVNAFSGCSGLKTLNIASGVTSILQNAFSSCTGLETITFPATVNEIGAGVVSGCNITTFKIPNSVKSITANMFSGCTKLKSVTMGSITSIGNNAFERCSALTEFTIPSTVTKIGQGAFANSGLTSITIPSTVKQIDSSYTGAFSDCKKLESFTIEPGGITEIGESMFKGDSALNNVTIPYDVKTIGNNAFQNCTALTTISLPSVESISTNAFMGSGLTSIMIPSETIGNNAFKNCKSLESVAFADTVKTISSSAFQGCIALKKITLPKNLESLDPSAFRGCTVLEELNAPEGSADYSSSNGVLFNADKSELVLYPAGKTSASYSIPNSVKTIKTYAFYQASKLTSVTIPKTVENFESYAFSESGLKTLTIPEGVTSIGDTEKAAYTFANCKNLTTVTISGTVKTLANMAFNGCTSLETVNLAEGLESLGSEGMGKAFMGCSSLVNITIPSSVKEIGSKTFYGCSSLKSIEIPEGVEKLGNQTFYNCKALTDVELPESLTSLGEPGDNFIKQIFYGCTSLESIDIPENVTYICDSAFQGCTGLKSVVLRSGITTLPANLFSGCTNPELKIYIMGTIDPKITTTNTFQNFKGKVYVYNQLTKDNLSTVVKSPAEIIMPVDFTELQGYIAQAKALVGSDYTVNSYSLVVPNMVMAERVTANKDATPEEVKSTTLALKKAINGLVKADNSDAYDKLQETIDSVSAYKEDDYSVSTYTALTYAVTVAQSITKDNLISEIDGARKAIETAIDNLLVAYLDSNASIEKYIYPNDDTTSDDDEEMATVIANGVVDEAIAGAAQVRFTFDCATDVQYNPYTAIYFRSTVGESVVDEEFTGTDSSYANGSKGWTATLLFENPLEVGDEYEFIGSTESWWGTASDYAFEVTKVELLDEDGNLLGVVGIDPKGGLEAAINRADALDLSKYTDESVQALQEALAAAKAVDEVAYPLPSEIDAALSTLNNILNTLKIKEADYKAVDDALAKVPSDLSKYTDDTVKALQDAVNAVKKGLSASDQAKVDGFAKAIEDAVKGLKEKTVSPPNSSNDKNNNNGGNTNVNKPNTPSSATPAPGNNVNNAKNKAVKAMNQAKLSKLKVKSKAKKKITVKWNKVKGAKGYEVQVSTSKKFKKSKIIIKKKNVKKLKLILKNKKIKSGKTYYVRVRAFATYKDNGVTKRINSSWNKKLRKVKVK